MRRHLLLFLLAALALAGCGGSDAASPGLRTASLVLDFTPNAVHAGIYEALARHDDQRHGLRLHVIVPSASTDAIRLLQTGRVNFAVLDIHDLALARARGQDIVGIMALVQRPLASVIAAPEVRTPRAMTGRTVGVTGVPSDTAVLRSVVAGAGGSPARVHTITIGFNAVADLLAGRVAAATAFWNDEGVTLQRRTHGFHIFRVDRYGAPSYPELIVCATGNSLRAHPALARSTVATLVQGYEQLLRAPAAGARALVTQVPGLDASLQRAELRVLEPAFAGPGGRVGGLDPARLEAWAAWETRFGIVRRPPAVGAMFSRRFLPAG
jgi:NitT/TauT family transport system substrate-binding protein/putative hydroxymethylpyrimidine transport system substrate-binding protein